jgi:hypothetical protein
MKEKMRSFLSFAMLAVALVSPAQAWVPGTLYAVRASCPRSGATGIGSEVTVAAAAEIAVAECMAAGGSRRCCRAGVTLWHLFGGAWPL